MFVDNSYKVDPIGIGKQQTVGVFIAGRAFRDGVKLFLWDVHHQSTFSLERRPKHENEVVNFLSSTDRRTPLY